jgi:hypothetical protein
VLVLASVLITLWFYWIYANVVHCTICISCWIYGCLWSDTSGGKL